MGVIRASQSQEVLADSVEVAHGMEPAYEAQPLDPDPSRQ